MKNKKSKARAYQPTKTDQPKNTDMANDNEKPTWDVNIHACRNTHALLVALKQLTEGFDDAGEVPMKKLAFWIPTASSEMRKLLASGIAAQLDKIYTKGYWADYEQDFDFHDAIDTMASVLTSENKTVAELAATVDRIYHFRGEGA